MLSRSGILKKAQSLVTRIRNTPKSSQGLRRSLFLEVEDVAIVILSHLTLADMLYFALTVRQERLLPFVT